MTEFDALLRQQCVPRTDGLDEAAVSRHLQAVEGWVHEGEFIARTFTFPDYYRAMAFVNALAWIVHAQDHHPEIVLTYNRCVVRFNTHSVNGGQGGISENDFICAAHANRLYAEGMPGTAQTLPAGTPTSPHDA